MTAQMIMDILDRNNQHGILLVRDDGSVYEIVYLEQNRFEGTQLRCWFFDNEGNVFDTSTIPAPNGEMDLLAEYADDIDTYGGDMDIPISVTWC